MTNLMPTNVYELLASPYCVYGLHTEGRHVIGFWQLCSVVDSIPWFLQHSFNSCPQSYTLLYVEVIAPRR